MMTYKAAKTFADEHQSGRKIARSKITLVNLALCAILTVAVPSLHAQYVDWVLHIGGSGDDFSSNRIVVDYDGNAIIGGYFKGTIRIGTRELTSQTPDANDAFVAKVTPGGAVAWILQIRGVGNEQLYPSRAAVDRRNWSGVKKSVQS